MDLTPSTRSSDVVARLRGAVVERGGFRLGPVDLEIGWQDRVAIVGPNGSGKSTLIGAILGDVPLAAGERYAGPGTVFGVLDQRRLTLSTAATLLAAVVEETGLLPEDARSLLAKFGLTSEHVARSAGSLSPGERTRALLAVLMAQGVNCLVLDEPTNHLDLPGIEQLEDALARFQGTLLLVTHDRALLDHVRITRSFDVENVGTPAR